MTSKRDHERDAELDKKIKALRRKNEALMKRYKVRTSAPAQRDKKDFVLGCLQHKITTIKVLCCRVS